jgi:hypothetical protein
MTSDDSERDGFQTTFAATRIVSKSFELEGIEFSWWAVDQGPAFVTVSSKWFGSKSAFSHRDPEATAKRLAGMIINQYRSQVDAIRTQQEASGK